MTTASGVAVIATQVARTDRRALSEAWYSALHLAHAPAAHTNASPHAIAHAPLTPRPQRESVQHDERRSTVPAGARRSHRTHQPSSEIGIERRRPVCANARRIERAVTALAARWDGHASQTVDVGGGRVRLLVRTDRGATRIIAVCSPPLRETVERALAQARFALATAGVPVAAP